MSTEAQRAASKRYAKANIKQIGLKFATPEHDLYDWVKSQENTAGYIKRLIREDMERRK